MKLCTHCHHYKPKDAFTAHKHTLDGLQSWCKECTKWACRRYRTLNAEAINARRKELRALKRTPVQTNPGTVR